MNNDQIKKSLNYAFEQRMVLLFNTLCDNINAKDKDAFVKFEIGFNVVIEAYDGVLDKLK